MTAQAAMHGNFDDADANHDGRISAEEFDAFATGRLDASSGSRAQMFRQMTPAEQATHLKDRFDRMDNGHKGYLDRSDWNAS